VSFRLLGIPVSIHASFLLVTFFFGMAGPELDPVGGLIWVAIITVSVVAHELGHALVARPARGEPRIDLFGIAGVTRWNAAHATRGRQVAVSLSGVGAGIAFGLALLPLYLAVDPVKDSLPDYAFKAAFFANLGWGLVNLLPMLPLDGGQVVRVLMPARDDLTRERRAAMFSAVVAGTVAVGAALADEVLVAALVVWFGYSNVQTLLTVRRLRGAAGAQQAVRRASELLDLGRPQEALELVRDHDSLTARVVAAAAHLRLDNAAEAQRLLVDAPEGARIDPVFQAAVLLANGQERLAREKLDAARAEAAYWPTRELAALLHRRGEDVDEVLAGVRGQGAAGVATALFHEGDYTASARWGETALGSGYEDPMIAYNVACAWSRAGELDKALRAFDHAILLGFDAPALADADEDLADARAHPGWESVRARLGVPEPRG
jgi:Zn-dependent protease